MKQKRSFSRTITAVSFFIKINEQWLMFEAGTKERFRINRETRELIIKQSIDYTG